MEKVINEWDNQIINNARSRIQAINYDGGVLRTGLELPELIFGDVPC